ncbi:predicted DNA-binding protein [Vibrio maritimus]|uniref:Predicted DNA-binding protein n=1 Tax=Vibrio maritimus TaxID=990268 RepID=A0A090TYF7_9VIBR|nr:predicted DNA-binding protein [Vibrio maritimus]
MTISLIATRLTRGQDLKLAIAELILQHKLTAGAIASCVGCLSKVHLRLAGAERTLLLEEPLEIVSIMGTLTLDHQHIHISVANQHGEVLGGHLLEGSIIDTTAELLIHHYPVRHFVREYDSNTGYSELVTDEN